MFFQSIFKKYNHALVLLYGLIYMPWFMYLEDHVTTEYYLIQTPIDEVIPFVEIFILPYLTWFLFIMVGGLFVFFKDKHEFLKMATFMIIGMTIFLIICTIFPNGQNLRPEIFPRDNYFTDLVKDIYSSDTATNVFPSMHVFNSIGVYIGLSRIEDIKKRPLVRFGILTLVILIILSTIFLKQHSILDGIGAIIEAGILYYFIYIKYEHKTPAHT